MKNTTRTARTLAAMAALSLLGGTPQAVAQSSLLGEEATQKILKVLGMTTEGGPTVQDMPLRIVPGKTHFLSCCTDGRERKASPVGQGVFGLTEDGINYTFYHIDGRQIGGVNEWAVTTMDRIPEMTLEGLLMRKGSAAGGASADKRLWLLTPDATPKPLQGNYLDATNFVDGLCAVSCGTNQMTSTWHFMDASLKIVYPNIKTEPRNFGAKGYTIAPKTELLRAVYVSTGPFAGAWGYMREDGKMAIQPKYSQARAFSGGQALVCEGDFNPDFYFINHDGQKRFEPKKAMPSLVEPRAVSDFDPDCFLCAIGLIPDEESFDQYYTYYYTADGEFQGRALSGTAFHKGTAFYRDVDKEGEEHAYEMYPGSIGKSDLRARAELLTCEWGSPWVDDYGLMHYSAREISNGIGLGSQYPMFWEVGDFSREGYASATVSSPNGMQSYTGIVDGKGEFVIVFRVEGSGEPVW